MFNYKNILAPRYNPLLPYSYKNYAVKAVSIIILLYFTTSLLVPLLEFILPLGENQHIFEIYTQGLWQILFLLLPTLYFANKSLMPTKTILRINKSPSLNVYIFAILGILIFQVFSSSYLTIQEYLIPNSLLGYYKSLSESMDKLYLTILGGSGSLDFIRAIVIGAFIPAMTEETLFRGFFQRSLEEELPVAKAIIYPSLVFAFIHLNPISFIPLFGIGIYLGIVAYATDNLLVPIVVHFINNAIAITIMFIPSISEMEDNISKTEILPAVLLLILSFFAILGIIYHILKKYRN